MKKTFTDNPAMNFITQPEEENEPLQDLNPEEKERARTIAEMKLSGQAKGKKVNPLFVEAKTRRVSIVLAPSLYKVAKKRADKKGLSFNEYINSLVELDVYTE